MTPHSTKSLTATLAAPIALFTAGVLSADRINHFIATRDAIEPVPRVAVEYAASGVTIDGTPYANGRLGGPRCDWNEIALGERRDYALDALVSDNGVLSDYLISRTSEQKQQLVYRTLVHLAREHGTTPGKQAEDIQKSLGWRWNLVYTVKTAE